MVRQDTKPDTRQHNGPAGPRPRLSHSKMRTFATLFEEAEWGFAIWAPHTDTFVAANPAFAEMLGLNGADLANGNPHPLITPYRYLEFSDERRVSFRTTLRPRPGVELTVKIDATAVDDDSGQRDWVLFVHDQSEVKRSEEAFYRLAREHSLLRSVLDELHMGLTVVEAPSGRVLLENKRNEEIWRHPGFSAQSELPYREYAGFHRDGRPTTQEDWPIAKSLASGEPAMAEFGILHGDGTLSVVRARATAIKSGSNGIEAALMTLEEIGSTSLAS